MIDREKIEEFKLRIRKPKEGVIVLPLEVGMLAFDELETFGFLIASSANGYRFTGHTFKKFMNKTDELMREINDKMIEFKTDDLIAKNIATKGTLKDKKNVIINNNNNNRRFSRELKILKVENLIDIKKPKLKRDNLAVDICRTMFFYLIGNKWKKGTKLPKYLHPKDVLKSMGDDYVFEKD